MAQSNTSIPKSPIHSITSQSSISPPIKDHSDHSIEKNNADPISQNFDSISLDQTNIPSVIDQYVTTQSKSLEDDRETYVFLDDIDKKMVSDKIRQRNREKKIQHELTIPFNLSLVTETSLRNDEIENSIKTVSSGNDRNTSEKSELFGKPVSSGNDQPRLERLKSDCSTTDDSVELTKNQNIELDLIYDLLNCSIVAPPNE